MMEAVWRGGVLNCATFRKESLLINKLENRPTRLMCKKIPTVSVLPLPCLLLPDPGPYPIQTWHQSYPSIRRLVPSLLMLGDEGRDHGHQLHGHASYALHDGQQSTYLFLLLVGEKTEMARVKTVPRLRRGMAELLDRTPQDLWGYWRKFSSSSGVSRDLVRGQALGVPDVGEASDFCVQQLSRATREIPISFPNLSRFPMLFCLGPSMGPSHPRSHTIFHPLLPGRAGILRFRIFLIVQKLKNRFMLFLEHFSRPFHNSLLVHPLAACPAAERRRGG